MNIQCSQPVDNLFITGLKLCISDKNVSKIHRVMNILNLLMFITLGKHIPNNNKKGRPPASPLNIHIWDILDQFGLLDQRLLTPFDPCRGFRKL